MLAHESLALASDALALLGLLEVVRNLREAGIEVGVPGAVIAVAQHLGEPRGAVTEVEPAGEDDHPGAVRGVGARGLGAIRIDTERDLGARADGGELLPLHRSAAP